MNKEEKINYFESEIARTIKFLREGKISATELALAWRNICYEILFLSYEAGFYDGESGEYALDKWVEKSKTLGSDCD